MRTEKLITRTFTITYGKMLLVDVETQKTETLSFKLLGNYKTKEEVFKAFRYLINSGTNKIPVQVLEFFTEQKSYGITQENFINNAVELDTETKKPIRGIIEDES